MLASQSSGLPHRRLAKRCVSTVAAITPAPTTRADGEPRPPQIRRIHRRGPHLTQGPSPGNAARDRPLYARRSVDWPVNRTNWSSRMDWGGRSAGSCVASPPSGGREPACARSAPSSHPSIAGGGHHSPAPARRTPVHDDDDAPDLGVDRRRQRPGATVAHEMPLPPGGCAVRGRLPWWLPRGRRRPRGAAGRCVAGSRVSPRHDA